MFNNEYCINWIKPEDQVRVSSYPRPWKAVSDEYPARSLETARVRICSAIMDNLRQLFHRARCVSVYFVWG
jgi:hypothetical protein